MAHTIATIDDMLGIVTEQFDLVKKVRDELMEENVAVNASDVDKLANATCNLCKTAVDLARMKASIESTGGRHDVYGFCAGPLL